MQGTLLVGRMHAKWRDGERGRLYRLDPGSRCVVWMLGAVPALPVAAVPALTV